MAKVASAPRTQAMPVKMRCCREGESPTPICEFIIILPAARPGQDLALRRPPPLAGEETAPLLDPDVRGTHDLVPFDDLAFDAGAEFGRRGDGGLESKGPETLLHIGQRQCRDSVA